MHEQIFKPILNALINLQKSERPQLHFCNYGLYNNDYLFWNKIPRQSSPQWLDMVQPALVMITSLNG